MSGGHNQLTFSGLSKDCQRFSRNPFKPSRCSNCSFDLREHTASSVTEEDILFVLQEEQAKDGANIILSPSDGLGALFLGGYTSCSPAFVKQNSITHVVNTAKDLESFFVGWGKKVYSLEQSQAIKILRLDWVDGCHRLWKEKPWDQFIEGILFIHSARKDGKNVVVHCAQGKSRSATLVVAYLMVINNEKPSEALAFIRKHRPTAEPNVHFMQQLEEFYHSNELKQLKQELCQL
eukprot:TRINITY_DN5574_c0_g1_i1.p1 TRINITY_DN5574_c0_g1~~TRINITY_DN5574_c0_g1_i1.p1  ORF type:complete len:235 (-),score=34.77 TRINITY_DN5574_c0_g1_i1:307-1011(-)